MLDYMTVKSHKRKVRQDLKTENRAEGTALLNAGGMT